MSHDNAVIHTFTVSTKSPEEAAEAVDRFNEVMKKTRETILSVRDLMFRSGLGDELTAEEKAFLAANLGEDDDDVPRWTEGQPPWTDGDALLFQIVLKNGETETHIGCVDDSGTMVDLEYRDDIGWHSEDVDRWIKLYDVLNFLNNQESRPPWEGAKS